MDEYIKSIKHLRTRLEVANIQYDKRNKICHLKKHGFYKFCAEKLKESENYEEKLSNILDITTNKFIDVIFIGRCSVGKSKIINAILMENILPCAPSATTHCFVEISESKDDINYLRCNKNQKKSFEFDKLICEVNNNVSKMSDSCCGFNEPVEIFVAQSRWNTKLTNGKQNKNIRLIDTPGYDNCKLLSNSNNNSSIEKSIIDRCKIANIIVLVVTYNLSDKEKEILMELDKISSKLSIFVLVNKWDLSDNDSDEINNISKTNILQSFDMENVGNNIYFISSVEQMKLKPIQNNDEENYNFNERKETFYKFIEDLNKEINEQIINGEFLKFDKYICSIKVFNSETTNKYEEYVENLSNNIGHFIDIVNEIKNKLDSIKNKIEKNISQRKQIETINYDEFVDKLAESLDLVEENLQEILKDLFDDFINENYSDFDKYHEQIKQLRKTKLHKLKQIQKSFVKLITFKFLVGPNKNDDVKNDEEVTEVATELTDSTNQTQNIFVEFIDSYLSEITKQLDNMTKFFNKYRDILITLK